VKRTSVAKNAQLFTAYLLLANSVKCAGGTTPKVRLPEQATELQNPNVMTGRGVSSSRESPKAFNTRGADMQRSQEVVRTPLLP
jgi:hypothetical protein